MKAVLDTNVLIAALISQGACADLVEHCLLRHSAVSSEEILAELRGHLAGKFKYSPEETADAVDLSVADGLRCSAETLRAGMPRRR